MPKKPKKSVENDQLTAKNDETKEVIVSENVEAEQLDEVAPETSNDPDTFPVVIEMPADIKPKDIFQSRLVEEILPEVEVKPKAKNPVLTSKQIFEKAIKTTPFTLLQNGILICHHSDFLRITLDENYFEINFKKYSYEGIEIKYI